MPITVCRHFAALTRIAALFVLVTPVVGHTSEASELSGSREPVGTSQGVTQKMRDSVMRPVVLKIDGMDSVRVSKDLKYSASPDKNITMDIYRPGGVSDDHLLPAILFVHGGAKPEFRPKEWGIFVSWGKLAAASGLAAVTFTHRLGYNPPNVEEGWQDLQSALDFLGSNGKRLGIDPRRMCVAAFSAGGPLLAPLLAAPRPEIACVMAFYAYLDIRQVSPYREQVPDATRFKFSPIGALEAGVTSAPTIFLARAGQDATPGLNRTIDQFAERALQANLAIQVVNHPNGVHAFDNQSDDERSRHIIRAALQFAKGALSAQ